MFPQEVQCHGKTDRDANILDQTTGRRINTRRIDLGDNDTNDPARPVEHGSARVSTAHIDIHGISAGPRSAFAIGHTARREDRFDRHLSMQRIADDEQFFQQIQLLQNSES